jgi:tetratricopeptide (TPR) repeat protein
MMDLVRQRLNELNQHPTVSRFVRRYYAFAASRLDADLPASEGLLEVFLGHLEAEIAYHERLESQNRLPGLGITVREMAQLAQWHRNALETCVRRLRNEVGEGAQVPVTAALLEAACAWGLGAHAEAVEWLERALHTDEDMPVVHFALGLNRFLRAEQEYTGYEAEAGEHTLLDRVRYRARLLEAVSAFEDSLTGGPLDADAHAWIALCLRRAGFGNAVLAVQESQEEATDEEAQNTGSQPGPITLEEIRHVAQALKRPQNLQDWVQGEGHT